MANARQTAHAEAWGVEDMVIHNHELVREHIDDLLKEGAVLRAERLEAERRTSMVRAVVGSRRPTRVGSGVLRPARLRIGRWLVTLGWAVAGCAGESHPVSERAGRAV